MVMKTLNEIISILKEYKKTMSSQYGIKRLGVFGSVARGEQTESSDLDIRSIFPNLLEYHIEYRN